MSHFFVVKNVGKYIYSLQILFYCKKTKNVLLFT